MENKFRFAKGIIYQAGDFLMQHLYDDMLVFQKSSPTDLVTQMDQKIQDDLVQKILNHYPNDAILAEENDLRHDISKGNVWVIDPIDGTSNFVTQKADFAIMLAYFENGVGQFGLIYDVSRNLLFHGGGKFDVYCNDKKLSPFQDKPFSEYLLASNASMLENNDWGLTDLAHSCLGVRVYGSAGISFSKIFAGGLLAYFSYICPWDYAAASILAPKLNFTVLTLEGKVPDFQTKQPVMMVPTCKLPQIQTFLKKGKNNHGFSKRL